MELTTEDTEDTAKLKNPQNSLYFPSALSVPFACLRLPLGLIFSKSDCLACSAVVNFPHALRADPF